MRSEGQGKMECESVARPRFHFGGFLGQRIDANESGWLLRAPRDNPGLLDMFRVRDADPPPDLVPWAGEFAGKYLLSAIQAPHSCIPICASATQVPLK